MRRQLPIFAAALALQVPVQAFAAKTFTIQSNVDKFELQLNGSGGGTVNGKPADMSALRDLMPVLTSPMTSECPKLNGKPDVTVKEGNETRSIYISQGVVSDGKTCLGVGGEGLMYFPVHRDFLLGGKQGKITVKVPIKVFRQGVKLFELVQSSSGWSTKEKPQILLNWDFINRFQNSLASFDVRFRALPQLGKDKIKMIVQIGDQAYEFYKLTGTVWALKAPGKPYLEASDDWSFWYDFDNGVLEDRFTDQIRTAGDSAKPAEERMAALRATEQGWSPNLRDLYHQIVLDRKSDSDMITFALRRLKSKPAKETAVVMAQFIGFAQDDDHKRTASQILKINEPKGPLYNPGSSPGEKQKVIEFWSKWWEKNQNSR